VTAPLIPLSQKLLMDPVLDLLVDRLVQEEIWAQTIWPDDEAVCTEGILLLLGDLAPAAEQLMGLRLKEISRRARGIET
jgi:hypothetical protein